MISLDIDRVSTAPEIHLPVANPVVVEVAEGVEGLSHHNGSLGFGQVLALGNEEEKLSALAQLCDQEADSVGLPSLVQLDDVGVVLHT